MRPDLLVTPDITPDVLADVLTLVGEHVPIARIKRWAPLERAIAGDWAMRQHFRASDNLNHCRDRPSLLDEPPLLALLRDLHRPYPIYENCSHAERDENDEHLSIPLDGDEWTCPDSFLFMVCQHCCTDGGTNRSDHCAGHHEHGPGQPVCPTMQLLDDPAAQ